jgi:hypothetical protein
VSSQDAEVLDVEALELRAEGAEGTCGRLARLADKALLELGSGDYVNGDVARGMLMAMRGIAREGSGQ